MTLTGQFGGSDNTVMGEESTLVSLRRILAKGIPEIQEGPEMRLPGDCGVLPGISLK